MPTRLSVAAPFAVLLAAAVHSQGKLETIEQILPGVWFRQGDLDQFGHCNNIIIEMKDYLIVVDANYPSGARAAMADIKKVSSKPVKYVFDTHHHGDHAYGNALWTKAGATTLAFPPVADEMQRVEPGRWQADAAQRKDVAELNLPTAEPPQKTFDTNPYVIDDGTRRVEFHFFGWAHTRGDGFVFLPKERVLCTGDAAVNGPFNGFGDGNAANWPNVVHKARGLNPKHVLPAHGPAGGPEILVGQERYLTEIYNLVKQSVAAGRPLPEPSALSPAVKNWTGTFTIGALKDIREEIVQGKPRGAISAIKPDPYNYPIRVPRLESAPAIDGDLSEWKHRAFSDGVWDIARLRQTPWFDPAINRLTDHGNEPPEEDDLRARYYIAWDDKYLYLGADVTDNVNDVSDPQHEPKRWYFKDAICWFIEAPRSGVSKKFGAGDNAFCFVIDAGRPPYAAWWRHGAPGKTYLEEPLTAADYALRMNGASFTLEARVAMAPTLGASSPDWKAPKVGDIYGLEIVHTDPDGGGYGGHFIIYGRGDDDATWGQMTLAGPITPPVRKTQ